MKIINIPSIKSEGCNTILKFHDRKFEVIPWDVDVECSSPAFHGKMSIKLESEYVNYFISDLKIIERDRKGECQLGYQEESGFSLTTRSIDSVGHFVVEISFEKNRESHVDILNISYEIEPSLLIALLQEFNNL